MIIELLFNLLFGILDFIIGLLPTIDFEFSDWFGGLSTVFQYIDMFCDVRLLVLIISTVLIRDNFVFLKNIFMSIVSKIPFIG